MRNHYGSHERTIARSCKWSLTRPVALYSRDTMMRTVQSPAVRVLSLSLALLVVAISASHQSYDPTMRNYVETCDEMAQLAGDNFCRVMIWTWFARCFNK
ncbi:unnamed protein product [Wuchereria bancrofti]|nr:unnamed protein product [Wuchereria bancrofti]